MVQPGSSIQSRIEFESGSTSFLALHQLDQSLVAWPGVRIRSSPELVWISITGYGRDEPQGSWIAFGDDAGVAAGLSHMMRSATGSFEFAVDAIADPLTGIHAALVGWQRWRSGEGGFVALSLRDVAAGCLAQERSEFGEAMAGRLADWWRSVRS